MTATASFPVGGTFSSASTFNAGIPNDPDRALAVGVSSNTDNQFLQLLTKVTDSDANAFQLQFDIEAWDSRDGVDVPPFGVLKSASRILTVTVRVCSDCDLRVWETEPASAINLRSISRSS